RRLGTPAGTLPLDDRASRHRTAPPPATAAAAPREWTVAGLRRRATAGAGARGRPGRRGRGGAIRPERLVAAQADPRADHRPAGNRTKHRATRSEERRVGK